MAFWAHLDLSRELTALKYSAERAWRLTGEASLEPADIDKLEYAKSRIDRMLEESKRNAA